MTLARGCRPFGDLLASANSTGSSYGFTNEYQNSYIKLIYLRSRMYSTLTGRFLTRDFWQGDYTRPLSLNRWNYTEGNPVNRTDPSGLCWVTNGSDDDGRWYPDADYHCVKKQSNEPQEDGPVWNGPDSYGSVVDSLAFSNSGNIRNTFKVSNTPEPLSSYAEESYTGHEANEFACNKSLTDMSANEIAAAGAGIVVVAADFARMFAPYADPATNVDVVVDWAYYDETAYITTISLYNYTNSFAKFQGQILFEHSSGKVSAINSPNSYVGHMGANPGIIEFNLPKWHSFAKDDETVLVTAMVWVAGDFPHYAQFLIAGNMQPGISVTGAWIGPRR